MKEVKWGIIGTGDVTEVKSGPGLYKCEHSCLIGVYNINYEKAADYAKRHKVPKVYNNVDEMFSDKDIDVVYIATPPKFHKDYALQCLNAKKIPYIEKPVANTYDECLEIKSVSQKLNIPVYVAFYRRGWKKFLKMKSLLDNREIGNVRYIHVTQTMPVDNSELNKVSLPWRVIPEISGGGKFLDMGVHVLDCLVLYFGHMESMDGIVKNQGGYYDADDTIMATFKFRNGIVGTGTWCYVANEHINEVHIVGSHGSIVYDGLSAKRFTLIKNKQEHVFEFEVPEHAAMPYQQSIVNELIGKEKSYASFDDAINIVQMTDALLSEYRTGERC